MNKDKKTRIINPPNQLKQKVGSGGLNESTIEKGQDFIEQNNFDFEPYALDFLKNLEHEIKNLDKHKTKGKEGVNRLILPVLELKSNGAMFNYSLISEISAIILNFLENIDTIDEDTYDILKALERTLNLIVKNKMSGKREAQGAVLTDELFKACQRYYHKHGITPQS